MIDNKLIELWLLRDLICKYAKKKLIRNDFINISKKQIECQLHVHELTSGYASVAIWIYKSCHLHIGYCHLNIQDLPTRYTAVAI
jgi:hypothetical protein